MDDGSKFLEWVKQMDLSNDLNQESLKLIYHPRSFHIWDPISSIVTSRQNIQRKKDALVQYEKMKKQNVLSYTEQTDALILTKNLDTINAEIDRLKLQKTDMKTEAEKLVSEQNLAYLEVNQLEMREQCHRSAIPMYENKMLNYSDCKFWISKSLASIHNFKRMVNHETEDFNNLQVKQNVQQLNKITKSESFQFDYEKCNRCILKYLASKYVKKEVNSFKTTHDDSLGTLFGKSYFYDEPLSTTSFFNLNNETCHSADETVFNEIKQYLHGSLKSILFELLTKEKVHLSKMCNNSKVDFTECREILVRNLLDAKIHKLKLQLHEKESGMPALDLNIYWESLEEELLNINLNTNTYSLKELEMQLVEKAKIRNDNIRILNEQNAELQRVFNVIVESNNNIEKAKNNALVKNSADYLEDLAEPVEIEEIQNLFIGVFLANTVDGNLKMETSNSLNYLRHETDPGVLKMLAENLSCTALIPENTLLEAEKRKDFSRCLKEPNYAEPILKKVETDEELQIKMSLFLKKFHNVIERYEEDDPRFSRVFKLLDLSYSLPFDKYVPNNPRSSYKSYLELKQEFDPLYNEIMS